MKNIIFSVLIFPLAVVAVIMAAHEARELMATNIHCDDAKFWQETLKEQPDNERFQRNVERAQHMCAKEHGK